MCEKNNTQQKNCGKKWTETRKELKKTKDRMKKYRMKILQNAVTSTCDPNTPSKAFSSPQALGKAIVKVKRQLPLSPHKQRAVITKLSIDMGIKLHSTAPTSKKEKRAVLEYYNSDLVSRILPGKKDYVTVKDKHGVKQSYQKRIMIMTVLEAHKLFKNEHPEVKIGKSTFAALRPAYVVPVSGKDHTVCCCKYHENYDLLVQGLKKFHPELTTSEDIMKHAVCEWEPRCCNRDCLDCSNIDDYVDALFLGVHVDEDSPGTFYQWDKTNKKALTKSTFREMKEELVNQLQVIIKHSFTAKIQLRQIKHLKSNLKEGEIVLHVDFAENFAIKQQNEIMAAHWVSEGVTLYTGVINDSEKATSFTVVSDDLVHDKCAVFLFNQAILKNYTQAQVVSKLHIFSDGAGSQFKNRYTLSSVLEPSKLCEGVLSVDWNFFGTAHGKGPVDGVGGTVKRSVWRRILQQKNVISTAEEFAVVAAEACPNIRIIYVPTAEVADVRNEMLQAWEVKTPKSIPNTHAIHHVQRKNENTIMVSKLSPYLENINVQFEEVVLYGDARETIKINKDEFVGVEYDGKRYPGVVEDFDNLGNYYINVMHPVIGGWKWPTAKDTIWYEYENIMKKIGYPSPLNDRGLFTFTDIV